MFEVTGEEIGEWDFVCCIMHSALEYIHGVSQLNSIRLSISLSSLCDFA